MATGTIRQIDGTDSFLVVVSFNLIGAMVVTTIACVGRVGVHVAGLTIHFAPFPMVKGEGVNLEACRSPRRGSMAVVTLQTESALMDLRLKVAVHTRPGGACEDVVDVALLALDLQMFAFQRQIVSMVKSPHPVHTVMTLQARIAEFQLVLFDKIWGILGMTARADLEVKLLQTGRVAGLADDRTSDVVLRVFDQAETGIVQVFERLSIQPGLAPPFGGMAGLTSALKQIFVYRGFMMATGALPGDALRLPGRVAVGTFDLSVDAVERETALSMIEISHPVDAVMTGKTAHTVG
jgi:hypothetical protein